MFSSARLKFLHERRQQLLVQSEVHRQLWAMEYANVQQRFAWLERTAASARRVLPWWKVTLPLWRFWFSRRDGAGKSWAGKITAALPIALRVVEVWQLFRPQRNDHGPASSNGDQTTPEFATPTTA